MSLGTLKSAYEEWHWGIGPKRVIHVQDPLIPDLVGIGVLEDFNLGDSARSVVALPFSRGTWLGFDPKGTERLYVVLLAKDREENRRHMKSVPRVELYPLQELAEATGGDQADQRLPNILARPLGICQAVTYFTEKGGETPPGPSSYMHHFGEEHSRGIKPILACDVSGRIWVCGGSYRCPTPGITG